MTHCKG